MDKFQSGKYKFFSSVKPLFLIGNCNRRKKEINILVDELIKCGSYKRFNFKEVLFSKK